MLKIVFLGLLLGACASKRMPDSGKMYLMDCKPIGTDVYSCKKMPDNYQIVVPCPKQ